MVNHLPFEESLPAWYSSAGSSHEHEANELQSVTRFAQSVQGWLGDTQGLALYQMARRSMAGAVLEIGSFCGKSTLFIALGCKHSNAPCYSVDPHRTISAGGKWQFALDYQPFEGNSLSELKKTLDSCALAQYVTLLVATSEEARGRSSIPPLKLLFIDGSHDYADVRLDYEIWNDLVVPGGRLVFHDSNFEGVNQTIHGNIDRDRYVHEGTVGDGGWAMTIWNRIK